MSNIRTYTGLGRAGDWSDPANWNGGTQAGPAAFAVIPVSTTMNGAFTDRVLMMLGNETVTVNGAITTTSPGFCISFMVCEGATAVFTPGASLTSAGGIVVGSEGTGNMVVQGNASSRSTITTIAGKMGLHAGSNGSMSVDGGVWNNQQNIYVGLAGNGSLVVDQGGVVNIGGNLLMAAKTSAHGTASITGGGRINVGGLAAIGGGVPVVGQGVASLSVGSGSSLDVAQKLSVSANSSLALQGGNVDVHDTADGIQNSGQITGFGTITSSGTISDNGTITASGGTLVLNGALDGKGQLKIEAASTAVLNASTIGKLTLAFTGPGGALDLAHGVIDHAIITGFTAGDSIVMAGVDQIGWNGSADVLTLSQGGSVVDTLQFSGNYSAGAFSLTQTDTGAVIGWNPTLSH